MSVLSNPENTTNAPTNCTNNGEVSVLEGTNGFGQDVYRCRGISHLFGGGLYDTWLGKYLQDQDTQDIDRIFRQEEAEAFKELLEGLESGTNTWRDLEEFELDFLAEIPEMVEYYDTLYSQVQINGFYEELENAETDLERSAVLDEFINAGIKTNPLILRDLEENDTDWDSYYQGILDGFSGGTEDPETTFEDVVEDLGEGIANTAKGIVDEWSDKITDCVGNPVDCIKKVGEALLEAGGVPDYCTDGTMTDPFFCTEKGPDDGGKVCWKDCVTGNLPGIPGLNIPLPPGVIDVGTYRDLENAVKTVGKTIGDIIDGNESCGPDGKQECTVGQVLEDLGTWAKETWEDVFSGVDDATGEDVLDWLKGILGPATAGIIWGEIEEEVTKVLIPVTEETKDCPDPANPGQTIEVPVGTDCPQVPVDCSSIGKFNPISGTVNSAEDCVDPCPNKPEVSSESTECKEDTWENTGPTPQECSNQNRSHIPDEAATQTPSDCGPCLEGFEEVQQGTWGGAVCQETEDPLENNGPTAQECAQDNRTFNPSTDIEDSSCGPCLSGFKEQGDQCIEDVQEVGCEEVDCNKARPGGSWTSPAVSQQWDECCADKHCPQDGSLITAHVDNDCTQGLISDEVTDDDLCNGPMPPQTQNDKNYCLEQGYSPCPEGTEEYGNGRWYKECTEITDDCSEITDDNYEACGKEKCSDGSFADVGACASVQPCEDDNRQKNPDGTCGDKCTDGSVAPETGLCPEPVICQDDKANNYNGSGECTYDDCLNGATDPEAGCVTCPAGMKMGTVDGEEKCVDDGLSETCDNGKTVESGCEECPEGTTDDGEGGCQQVFICEDPNATVVSGGPTAGACGPCKPGYVYDGAIEKCAKDGCPDGQFKDENGNCVFIPIDCPEEGEEFCETTGTCTTPEECPGGPTGSGGGGGGGGGGMFDFDLAEFGIKGDPQLLDRPRFGQQDFLTPLFAESQGAQTSFPIAQFLANQKGKV